METKFSIEKNGKSVKTFNSYQESFRVLCDLIVKENPKFTYIRKSILSPEEYKKVAAYYLNDGLYNGEEKVFGFGSYSFDVKNDVFSIKSI